MGRRLKLFFLILSVLVVITGCGEQVEGEFPTDYLPDSVEVPKYTDEPDKQSTVDDNKYLTGGESHPIGIRVENDGKMQSWLTGQWKDAEITNRRNMAVMLDNSRYSLPQYGISKADIIYEAPVEGRITRLMGLFEDYDELDHIGPVRSSRDYYVYEAMAYDSIYCNWGLTRPWVEELINSDKVDNISQALAGIYNGAPEAYDRISRPGVELAHTGYLFIDGYKEAMERLKYETQYRSTFIKAFDFADEGYLATYDDCDKAYKIYPGGTENNAGGYGKHQPCFSYNSKDRLYYRTQFGEKHIDEMNGEQLAVTNVVFKVCHGEERLPDDPNYDYLAFGITGTGDAYVFTNGKVVEGTWVRESDTEPNRLYDKAGNEIVLNQGKTWICCIWKEYAEYMKWE